jgi:hypothetical protein
MGIVARSRNDHAQGVADSGVVLQCGVGLPTGVCQSYEVGTVLVLGGTGSTVRLGLCPAPVYALCLVPMGVAPQGGCRLTEPPSSGNGRSPSTRSRGDSIQAETS